MKICTMRIRGNTAHLAALPITPRSSPVCGMGGRAVTTAGDHADLYWSSQTAQRQLRPLGCSSWNTSCICSTVPDGRPWEPGGPGISCPAPSWDGGSCRGMPGASVFFMALLLSLERSAQVRLTLASERQPGWSGMSQSAGYEPAPWPGLYRGPGGPPGGLPAKDAPVGSSAW